jgi:hypothetical protein
MLRQLVIVILHLFNEILLTTRTVMGDLHKIVNSYLSNDLVLCRDRRISIPLASSCSGKVDEPSLHITFYEIGANPISDLHHTP